MPRRIEIFQTIIAAWKAKDIPAVLSHMHADIVWHYAAGAEPPIRGRAQAERFLARFGARIAQVRWRVFDYAESETRLFVEGVDEYATNEGRVIMAAYAGVLDFEGDLVIGWRDYVDVGVVSAQMAGQPISEQVRLLTDRAEVMT